MARKMSKFEAIINRISEIAHTTEDRASLAWDVGWALQDGLTYESNAAMVLAGVGSVIKTEDGVDPLGEAYQRFIVVKAPALGWRVKDAGTDAFKRNSDPLAN